MSSTGKRILGALWVAGALAGLIAVVFLPGRLDRSGGPAIAHTTADVEIIDTQTSCQSTEHNLNAAAATITHATGTPGVTERQTLTITGSPTGGDFTLTFSGQTTAAIAFDATAATVATRLEALSNITDVTTGGGALPGSGVTVDFINPAGNVALMTSTDSFTGGSSPASKINETTAGVNEVQTVTLGAGATGGTFTLTFSGQTTAAIAFNAANATVETALEALSNVTDLTVTGGPLPGTALTVTFGIPGGNVAEMTSDGSSLIGDCTSSNANSDANPTVLNYDSNADTVSDKILVATGADVRIVAHVHTGTVDAVTGTNVTFSASGSDAVFTGVGVDADNDDELDNSGLLSVVNNRVVVGDVISDVDAANGGGGNSGCDSTADTCIDDAGAGDTDGTPTATDDGIAVAVITSSVATQSTVTVSSGVGNDTVDVIWTGAVATVALTRSLDDANDTTKAVDQTVIAQTGAASANAGVNGDPDLTITVLATDAAGNPVSGQDIDCTLDSVGAGRADIGTPASTDNDESPDDGITDPGGNSALSQTTDADGEVQIYAESENQGGNTRGDVTVTCWFDADAGNDLDATEIRGTTTFRVSGPPASVDLQGTTTMTVGVQSLSAVVTDADGEAVADTSNCTWLLVDPLTIAAFTSGASPSVVATDGDGGKTSNTLVAGAEGSVTVSVSCGTVTDLLSIAISGALPTDTPVPAATVTPGGPTQTPVPPAATATPGGPTSTPGGPTITPGGPTATAAPPPVIPAGDANCDTEVNVLDALLILQVDAGLLDQSALDCEGPPDVTATPTPPAFPAGDVNCDTEVNTLDALLILQVDAGQLDQSALDC